MNDLIEAWREQVRSAAAAGGRIAIRVGDTKAFYGRPMAGGGEPLDTWLAQNSSVTSRVSSW